MRSTRLSSSDAGRQLESVGQVHDRGQRRTLEPTFEEADVRAAIAAFKAKLFLREPALLPDLLDYRDQKPPREICRAITSNTVPVVGIGMRSRDAHAHACVR